MPNPTAVYPAPCLVRECGRTLEHAVSVDGGPALHVCLGHPPMTHRAVRRVVYALDLAGFSLVRRFGTFRCRTCGVCMTATAILERGHTPGDLECQALQDERVTKWSDQ